ncbi:hypothetical protein Zmor_005348 [Zophobas morio]|uniref:Uncharacterized protein n=1 Tax=Zophobas morio TaxID=2755281 RepID=A0AA38MLK8_9CUCU|nr:hypothetical protein Zmor_005348 [Zophobas morio]
MISKRSIQEIAETVTVYEAVNEIVLGIFGTIMSAFWIYASGKFKEDFYEEGIPYFYFFLVAAILCVFKGCLLLRSINYRKKQGILIYFVLTTLVLIIAKGFLIYEAIYRRPLEQAVSKPGERLDVTYKFQYFLFYPLVFLTAWFFQLCVILFYREVARNPVVNEHLESVPE